MVRVLYFTLLLTLHLLVPTQGIPVNTAVFDNSIQGAWQDWGFSSTIDTAGNSMSNMITARVNYNYGLYFRNPTGIASTNYAIEFEYQLVNIGTNNRDLSVDLYGPTSHTDQYVWRTSFSTANFDTWYNVTLPFANFVRVQDGYGYNSPAALPTTIYGFTLKQAWVQPANSGDPADPTERGVLFKRISIKPSSSSVYSYVVYNAPAVSVGEMIYQQSTGGLKSGWLDWSSAWSAGNASATASAASLTVNKNFYNGLYFSCVRNFDINRLATISYRVKVVNRVTAHGLGQYKVVFYDTSSPPVPIGDGYIVRSNSDTSYVNKTHPISIFNIPLGTMISGVAFMGVGRSSATFNFDEVKIGIPPSAGLSSDPIIDGFNGEKFDFKGVPKRIFNILSMPDLQINSFFIAGLNANETYSGAIGIKQSDSSFISFDLWGARLHQTNTTASGERPVIKELHYPLRNFEIPNGGLISRPSAGRMVIDWPLYSIGLTRMWERHGDQEITYIDISVSLRISNLDQKNIHGVLGQTYHRSWTATNETYVGTWEDYAAPAGTLDLFTDNFPQQYFKYNPNNQISHVAGESKSGGAVGKR